MPLFDILVVFFLTNMESLPVAVMVRIFSFLEVKDKCKVSRVCRSWYHLVREKQLWKHVDLTPFRVNLQATWKIIRCYFTDALKTLHLRGFLQSVKNTECISNAVLSNLCERCPNIEELHIEDAALTNIDSGNLPPTLKVLKLLKCQTAPGWFKAGVDKGRFDQLQTLNVMGSTRFCDEDLRDIASLPQGGKLGHLVLSNCYRLRQEGFIGMAEHLTNLNHLDVASTNISDDDMHFVCRNLKKLETLVLRDCDSLTDFCVASLATLPALHHLDIRGRDMKITGGAVIKLIAKLNKLEHLHLSLSQDLTDADVEQMAGANVKCQIISH